MRTLRSVKHHLDKPGVVDVVIARHGAAAPQNLDVVKELPCRAGHP